jgi:hypothetical protein
MIWSIDWRLGEFTPSATNREQMAQANRMVTTQPVKICARSRPAAHAPLPQRPWMWLLVDRAMCAG